MKALVKFGHQPGQVAIRDIPRPRIGPDDVLLSIRATGVCGSDIHLWQDRQSWPLKLPLVMGHEFCGVVSGVGENVVGFQIGDRVVCETAAQVCNRCTYCLSGHYNVCPDRKGYGALIDGAFTQYIVARPQILHHIPQGVTFVQAALTEPICVAYNALVEKTEVRPGDLVVIQGPGAIGLLALQVARIRGAGTVVVLGTDADVQRLAIAAELGAQHIVNIHQQDAEALVGSLGDSFGADVVVDCTGDSRALEQSLTLVRPNGQITKIGWGPRPPGVSLDPLVAKAVTLQGSFSHTYATWERVLALLAAGQINLDPIIGGVYSLDRWHEAFAEMEHGANIKSVLSMNTEDDD